MSQDYRPRLKAIMDERGLTAAGWARSAKLSVNVLYNYFAGRNADIRLETLGKLAGAVGLSLSEIIGQPEEIMRPTSVYPQVESISIKGELEAGVWRGLTALAETAGKYFPMISSPITRSCTGYMLRDKDIVELPETLYRYRIGPDRVLIYFADSFSRRSGRRRAPTWKRGGRIRI